MEQSRNIDELKAKIATDPDFINSKKHKYSLKKFLDQSPSGTTDNIIALFLCITPDEARSLYQNAVEKIRQKMKIVVK